MSDFFARAVFFVADAERARAFYTERLGFTLDWDSHDGVLQVSLSGFELILNEAGTSTLARAGHGRVYIGLEDDQGEPFRQHVAAHRIATRRVEWGRPTLVIDDVDGNELFFWVPNDDFTGFGTNESP